MFLKIPELLNDVIFQNSFEWLLFKNTPGNKIMFKVDDKKSTSATSVIVIRVPLSLAWNIILKSVTEFVFSKASTLYKKWQ